MKWKYYLLLVFGFVLFLSLPKANASVLYDRSPKNDLSGHDTIVTVTGNVSDFINDDSSTNEHVCAYIAFHTIPEIYPDGALNLDGSFQDVRKIDGSFTIQGLLWRNYLYKSVVLRFYPDGANIPCNEVAVQAWQTDIVLEARLSPNSDDTVSFMTLDSNTTTSQIIADDPTRNIYYGLTIFMIMFFGLVFYFKRERR